MKKYLISFHIFHDKKKKEYHRIRYFYKLNNNSHKLKQIFIWIIIIYKSIFNFNNESLFNFIIVLLLFYFYYERIVRGKKCFRCHCTTRKIYESLINRTKFSLKTKLAIAESIFIKGTFLRYKYWEFLQTSCAKEF